MDYKSFFTKTILENAVTPSPTPSSSSSGRPVHGVPNNAISPFLDQGTDPDKLLVDGIQDTFDKVKGHFNNKMNEFAQTLSPEAVKTLNLGDLHEKIGDVFKFVNKIQIYSKGKVDQIAQDPYAIMAAFLASEPTKLSAFEDLHGELDEFQKSVQELEGKLASLKGMIDDFVTDVEELDAEEAANDLQSRQSAGPELPSSGNEGSNMGAPPSRHPASV